MLAALAQYRKSRSTAPITAAIAWINAWQPPEELREFKEFDAYWSGAQKAAAKFGYRLEEFRIGREISTERLHQILTTRGITGILLPPQDPTPDWKKFPWENYSVVRFGRSAKNPRTHLATADQVAVRVMRKPVPAEAAATLQAYVGDDEKMQAVGGDIWIVFSRATPSSRLIAATSHKRLGIGTSRNWNTVRRLAEMVGGQP